MKIVLDPSFGRKPSPELSTTAVVPEVEDFLNATDGGNHKQPLEMKCYESPVNTGKANLYPATKFLQNQTAKKAKTVKKLHRTTLTRSAHGSVKKTRV